MSIELVIPSSHFILCHPLLLSSIFPSMRVISNESAHHVRWPKYWSFSFSINPSNEYSGLISFRIDWASLIAQLVKNPPAMQETRVYSLVSEDPLEKEMASHSVFLPGESHGQRSLAGYSLWGCKESDTTEQLSLSFFHQMTCWKCKAICSWRLLFTFILFLILLGPLPIVYLSVGFSPPFFPGVCKCLPSA